MICQMPAMMTLLPDIEGISKHGSLDKWLPEWDNHDNPWLKILKSHLHCEIVPLESGMLDTNVEVFIRFQDQIVINQTSPLWQFPPCLSWQQSIRPSKWPEGFS